MSSEDFAKRLQTAEQSLHTINFRLDQLDAHRLPDRVVGMEAAIKGMQQDFAELNRTAHRTNDLVNTVRAEINVDLSRMEEVFASKTSAIQSTLDRLYGRIFGVITGATVCIAVVAWIVERFDIFALLLKATGG